MLPSLFPGLLSGLLPAPGLLPPPVADPGLDPGLEPGLDSGLEPGLVPPGLGGLLVGGPITTGLLGWAGSLGGDGGRGRDGGLTGGPATEPPCSVALVAVSLQGAERWGKLQMSFFSSNTVPGGQLMMVAVDRDRRLRLGESDT